MKYGRVLRPAHTKLVCLHACPQRLPFRPFIIQNHCYLQKKHLPIYFQMSAQRAGAVGRCSAGDAAVQCSGGQV